MKNSLFLLFWLILTTGFTQAQSAADDVYVVSPAGDDQNLAQVEQRFRNNFGALFLEKGNQNPLESIALFLQEHPCMNLHLYIGFSDESLIFNTLKLTSQNIAEYNAFLTDWNKNISGKILIHNLLLSFRQEIPPVVTQLSEFTGIPVEIIRTY